MEKKPSIWVLAFFSCVVAGCTDSRTAEPNEQPPVHATEADAPILQDFHERIERYMELHRAVEKDAPRLKETSDAAKIHEAQKALAARLTEARAGAKQGEIFTPEIARLFRRLMYPELKGPDAPETKAALKEEKSETKQVPVAVNAVYPDTAPLPTVPPNLLAALPELPGDLEYRIIDRDLILHDIDANIIVDYIRNAIR
jgi:hypothetical protein